MSLRLIEIILPETESFEPLHELLEDHPVIEIWEDNISGKKILVKILDLLEKKFGKTEGFRIILLTVEASIPRPEKPKKDQPEEVPENNSETKNIGRISREELYADIDGSANITSVYLVLVVLSSIVASIEILKDNVAKIIGAMVIAPLLGPIWRLL
jgi:hypothetical protein